MDDLKMIECMGSHLQTDNCFTKMLTDWLRRSNPKSCLGALITTLRSPPVGLTQLADELIQKG